MTSSTIYRGIITAFSTFSLFLLHIQSVQAQWTKTSGPPGITVNVLYQSDNTLFAGTAAKGVFKSADNGSTWTAVNAGIDTKTVFSLISDGANLYAGTDDGVYRSSNNGTSWTAANNGIENQLVTCFTVGNGFLFAGTSGFGIFKSNNNGNSWTDANGGSLNTSLINAICFSSPNIITVANGLVYRSGNNGNSWTIPQNAPFVFASQVSFIVQHDSVLVNSLSGTFQSFDAGVSWRAMVTVDPNATLSGLTKSGNTVYAGSPTGLYSSNSFGRTWKAIPQTGLRVNNRINHAFCISGSKFILGFDEVGVALSSNKGKTWTYSIAGFAPASTEDNSLTTSGNLILTGTHSDGIYQSSNEGGNWIKIGSTDPSDSLSNAIVFSLLRVNNITLAGTCGYGLYRSTDNGATWTHIRNGLTQQNGTAFLCVNALAKSAENVLASTDQGLFYSTDTGLTWHLSDIPTFSNTIVGVAANDSVACAAVENFNTGGKIFRSTDKGITWVSIPPIGGDYTCMASDGKNHFYLGSFETGFVSNDNGLTFQNITGIPFGVGVFAFGILDNNVFVGNNDGVFFSNNNATSFRKVNTGFNVPTIPVQGFAFSSTTIYAGTFQNAVWKRSLSDFNISPKQEVSVAPELKLSVYPNPFSSNTSVIYYLLQEGNIDFTLYDENGKIVFHSNEFSSSGNHIKLISENFGAGMYLLKVTTRYNSVTEKLIVQ